LDLIIQWVASQFPAVKTSSLISLLAYINSCNTAGTNLKEQCQFL
jgi:hypothetical protein